MRACFIAILLAIQSQGFQVQGLQAQDVPVASATAPGIAAADLEFFEKRVRPLLTSKCFECHAGEEKSGGLRLDSRAAVAKGGDSGPVLISREPEKSRLVEAVGRKNPDLQMPPKKPLSDEEVAVLVEWIRRGAPDPREDHLPAAPLKGMDLESGRKFWAFMPVANPNAPEVQNKSLVRTPIDAFVLSKIETAGLTPAPPADKRSLLRRVTFNLIGLPPTPEETRAFLEDSSPSAFSTVVDRLLQSPHYGARWGRHWLDVVRYADSNGLDENLAFGNAWRYRDYVVDAFNTDKPFHRFLMEQVAGDLLPDADRETKTATGFLVLGAKVLAEPDKEKLFMDTIDEQIDTLGKAFLGMTLGCARCHDHKFDPITQADYYAMAAIFKSTRTFAGTNFGAIKHWNETSFASPDEIERMKAVDAAIAEKQKAANSFKSAEVTKIREAARELATSYLAHAALIDLDTPLTEVAVVAAPMGLHPRILHNCRRYLAFHRDDPFFSKWYELVESGCYRDIPAYYEPLFEAARDWAEAKKKDSKIKPLEDPAQLAAHAALFDNSGFLTVPAKVGFAFDPVTLEEYNRLANDARLLESFAPDLPSAMSVADGAVLGSIPIHIRGSHRNLGDPIDRAFPKVMQTSSVDPIFPRQSSGRYELAQWMASTTHPLTARVFVNRVWRWHFGAGLVNSTENFGVLGDRPSHPELLDWLARYFMESGWSVKELHRLILSSSVYQMSAFHPKAEACEHIDPENRWLWRFRAQRLDAEQIRDSILFVSGQLDESIGGKSVPLRNRQFVFDHTSIDHTKYDSLRRAIYLPLIRNNIYPMFEQFDFPDPTMPTGNRNSTIVAPQALLMMNSDLVMDSAEQFARQLLAEPGDDTKRIHMAMQIALGRDAAENELRQLKDFLSEVTGPGGVANASTGTVDTLKAWSLLCQSLLMSNEFFMVR